MFHSLWEILGLGNSSNGNLEEETARATQYQLSQSQALNNALANWSSARNIIDETQQKVYKKLKAEQDLKEFIESMKDE